VRLTASTKTVWGIHHKKKSEPHFKTCEDAYNPNPLISAYSVVTQNGQVCKKNEEEIAAHNNVILDKTSEKVVTVDDQFNVWPIAMMEVKVLRYNLLYLYHHEKWKVIKIIQICICKNG